MVRLLPILPPNRGKYERKTTPLPAFYLADTSDGLRGVLGAVDPKILTRVQRAATDPAPRLNNVFHGVYWSEIPTPEILVRNPSTQPRVLPMPQSAEKELQEYLSKVTVCLIGNEAELDAAIVSGENSVQIALWNARDLRLPWLPCHRVLRNVDNFHAGWMVCHAREHMFFRDVTAEMLGTSSGAPYESSVAKQLLAARENESVTILAIADEGAWRIHTQPGWADGLLDELHLSLREIAAVQLNHILLARGLDLSPYDGSLETRLKVVHRADDAVAELRNGAQVVYLLQPIRSTQLQELIKHGQMLPAKSVALDVAALEVWNDAE